MFVWHKFVKVPQKLKIMMIISFNLRFIIRILMSIIRELFVNKILKLA